MWLGRSGPATSEIEQRSLRRARTSLSESAERMIHRHPVRKRNAGLRRGQLLKQRSPLDPGRAVWQRLRLDGRAGSTITAGCQ